jgi:hypothetical protein
MGFRKKEFSEIDHDTHTRPGELHGFARIEVEFDSEADAAWLKEHIDDVKHKYHRLSFIGQDITGNKNFGSKTLAKRGAPPEMPPFSPEDTS